MPARTSVCRLLLIFIVGGAPAAAAPTEESVGLAGPEGFEVTQFAGDDLAHDIFSMTFDPRGRVVVAGKGYVKILHDEDADGRAERATLFSEFPRSGAHGMVFIGNDLIATGDNLLMRLVDADGDGAADRKPLPLAVVDSPEHGRQRLGPRSRRLDLYDRRERRRRRLPNGPHRELTRQEAAGRRGGAVLARLQKVRSLRPRLPQSVRPCLQ